MDESEIDQDGGDASRLDGQVVKVLRHQDVELTFFQLVDVVDDGYQAVILERSNGIWYDIGTLAFIAMHFVGRGSLLVQESEANECLTI